MIKNARRSGAPQLTSAPHGSHGSTQGQLKPRLILAEGFWDGLIQAAAYLGRENVRINALKRCPRLAEAVND